MNLTMRVDIDEKSLEYARANVKSNNLGHRINIIARRPENPMIPLNELNINSIDFTMTNPPFYSSAEDLLQSAAQKSRPPYSACTGSETEMVTSGGEVAFVMRILEESLVLRERVQWYTAMFGFISSVSKIVERLRQEGVDNFAVTEFIQGSKTRRWAVAWSFGGMRPSNTVARGMKPSTGKNILPPITETSVTHLPLDIMIGEVADNLAAAIGQLDLLSWDWDKEKLEGVGRAPDNVWNRAWRRKKKKMDIEAAQAGTVPSLDADRKPFGFRVSLRVGRENIDVTAQWLEGHDASDFESFGGYLKATITSLTTAK
jgi:23S rRNA (adenine1618-N6)-methyltransferase